MTTVIEENPTHHIIISQHAHKGCSVVTENIDANNTEQRSVSPIGNSKTIALHIPLRNHRLQEVLMYKQNH